MLHLNSDFDHHVHIGQWKDRYFPALEVFSELQRRGKHGCNFMSTTSCAPLNAGDRAGIAALYEKVRDEVKDALRVAEESGFMANAYYWVVPLFHLSGITFGQVFSDLPDYRGLKIHPLSHNWNPEVPERAKLMTDVFSFAKEHGLHIILHTGNSPEDSPRLYESWYKAFPEVKVTIAHCKKIDEVKYLFDNFPQLNGDTSFMPQENFEYLLENGYANRLVYGSDFPISA